MNAIRIDGTTPGGSREPLAPRIPLDTPFSVQIFPAYACNLACPYCIHSVPKDKRRFVASKTLLDMEIYNKFVHDMRAFPKKLKMLRFAGTGEPLLHPDLPAMISLAHDAGIAESLDIVTNGLRLSPQLSDALVAAGISRIRISLQGLDDSAYAYTGRQGVFEELRENIRYLYVHRKQAGIYVKIIDVALKSGEKEKFLAMFGDICNWIAIEHITPAVPQIDYTRLTEKQELAQNGQAVVQAQVCPQSFYMLQVNPDGAVVPCCAMETTVQLGNLTEMSMLDIWQGDVLREFRRAQLLGQKAKYPVCATCKQYPYAMFPEDNLDGVAKELLQKI